MGRRFVVKIEGLDGERGRLKATSVMSQSNSCHEIWQASTSGILEMRAHLRVNPQTNVQGSGWPRYLINPLVPQTCRCHEAREVPSFPLLVVGGQWETPAWWNQDLRAGRRQNLDRPTCRHHLDGSLWEVFRNEQGGLFLDKHRKVSRSVRDGNFVRARVTEKPKLAIAVGI